MVEKKRKFTKKELDEVLDEILLRRRKEAVLNDEDLQIARYPRYPPGHPPPTI